MPRLTLYALALIISLSSSVMVSGHYVSVQTEQKWERYTGKGESFTVSLPERPSALLTYRPARMIDYRKEEKLQGTLYSAYSDGVAYLIYSFPRRSEPLQKYIDDFAARYAGRITIVSARDVIDGVSGKLYAIKFGDLNGILHFYVTDKRAYILEAVGGDETNPSVKRFLESFLFGRAADPAVIEVGPGSDTSSEADNQQDTGPVFMPKEVTRKAVIILRQEPQYTEDARNGHVSGTVVLRAILSTSGKVTHIQVVKSLPRGLTEKAIETARQMIFIPAIKDGKFVSTFVQIEDHFSVF